MAASSSSNGRRHLSLVEDHGEYSNGCGYCRSSRSVSHGVSAYSLTVSDYQELLDRGWRRSGTLLYKPESDRTCCPAYTIRLEADKFVPSKDQMRVKRRMQRYLDGYDRQNVEMQDHNATNNSTKKPLDELATNIASALKTVTVEWLKDSHIVIAHSELPEFGVRPMSEKVKKQLENSDSKAHYTSNAAFLLAAMIKRGQNLGKHLRDNATMNAATVAESLAERLNQSKELEGIQVRACKGHLNFTTSNFIPSAKAEAVPPNGERVTETAQTETRNRKRSFEFRMQRSSFDPEEFQLYKRYQVAVHQERPEDIRESSYCRFLVDTPLIPVQHGSISYGSFHQQYRIDGRLVAVGVVDILPKCMSSKYLIWDPDLAFLSLGKFSVLKEIEWVQEAHRLSSLLRYYYLGYYIHSCPKMRYKASYYPSELLCPIKFQWVPFHTAQPLLGRGGSVCLSELASTGESFSRGTHESSTADDEDMNDALGPREVLQNGRHVADENPRELDAEAAEALGEIPLMLGSRCSKLKHLEAAGILPPQSLEALKRKLFKYWDLVGSQLASRMVYIMAPID